MSVAAAEMIVLALGAYLGVGVVIGVLFLAFGVARKDRAAKGASLFFRPMIFLGCVGLWPYLIGRLLGRVINHPHLEDASEEVAP